MLWSVWRVGRSRGGGRVVAGGIASVGEGLERSNGCGVENSACLLGVWSLEEEVVWRRRAVARGGARK